MPQPGEHAALMPAPVPKEERDKIIAEALAELPSGVTLQELAGRHGISTSCLCRWMLGQVPVEYRAAQIAGLVARVTDEDENLRGAKSFLEAQKFSKLAAFARFDLERKVPEAYSVRLELTGAGGGPITIENNLARAQRLMFVQALLEHAAIEAEAVEVQDMPVEAFEAPAAEAEDNPPERGDAAPPEHREDDASAGFRAAVRAYDAR
jgi:hypothetical protein